MIKVESNTISETNLVGEQEQVRRLERQGFSHGNYVFYVQEQQCFRNLP